MITRALQRALHEVLTGGILSRILVLTWAIWLSGSDSVTALKIWLVIYGCLFFLGAGGSNYIEAGILDALEFKQGGPNTKHDSKRTGKRSWDDGTNNKTS